MTREEAIEYWEGLRKTFSSQLEKEENHFGRIHLQTTIDALDMAISALRAKQEQEPGCICRSTNLPCSRCNPGPCDHRQETVANRNESLTLEELREAAETGDPVWLVRANCSSWVVIEKVDDRKYIQLVDYAEFGSDEPYDFAISDYGDTFKAYRQKPEEDKHEAD